MTEELKPCPFCGGDAELQDDIGRESTIFYRAVCADVECQGHYCNNWSMTQQRAISAWNTRAAATQVSTHPPFAVHNGETWRRVRECRNIYDGREFRCSECGMQWHLLDRADFGEEWAHVRSPAYCPCCGAKVVE